MKASVDEVNAKTSKFKRGSGLPQNALRLRGHHANVLEIFKAKTMR
jgi:hypothetical protein